MSDEDLELICEELRGIEKDLAFEVVEAYRERRKDDFANALTALKDLSDVLETLCKPGPR
ncbi:MAG: hypothetical protein HYU03_06380 [Thaumarchaeota archaeon]|nr:hypothetical protein [Nitrososphaerota archaeon]